jgi:hypothetical protein
MKTAADLGGIGHIELLDALVEASCLAGDANEIVDALDHASEALHRHVTAEASKLDRLPTATRAVIERWQQRIEDRIGELRVEAAHEVDRATLRHEVEDLCHLLHRQARLENGAFDAAARRLVNRSARS